VARIVLGIAALLWIISYPLADLWLHHFQWGSFHAGEHDRVVALTFDDGPAQDTAAILSVLRAHDVRATFFMVAERALEHPEWVKLVMSHGHEVALHGNQHRSAYLTTPWGTFSELRRGVKVLEEITGKPLQWYRPPWGHHSLWTWWASRRMGLTRVLWTVAPDDWNPKHSPEAIADHIVKAALAGSVVVLHDGGGDRERTRQALALTIPRLQALGLKAGSVGQLTPDPSWFRVLWRWWEARFQVSWDVDAVPARGDGVPILKVGRIRYQGREVPLAYGILRAGMSFGEIHFDNGVLSAYSRDLRHGLKAYHAIRNALADLAVFVADHPKYQAVAAFGGVTVLNAEQAVDRLGFRQIPMNAWKQWTMGIYLMALMAIYHRQGWRNLGRLRRLRPVMLVMDRTTLLERYGPHRVAPPESGSVSPASR
jgi:peptidoglycan/xylan/chitin deacetylase (PgdA/CDA1 family)